LKLADRVGFWLLLGLGVIYGLPRLTKRVPSTLVAIVVIVRDRRGVAVAVAAGGEIWANFLRTCQSCYSGRSPLLSTASATSCPQRWPISVCCGAAVVSHKPMWWKGLGGLKTRIMEAESQGSGHRPTSLPACLAAWQVAGHDWPGVSTSNPAVATASPPHKQGCLC